MVQHYSRATALRLWCCKVSATNCVLTQCQILFVRVWFLRSKGNVTEEACQRILVASILMRPSRSTLPWSQSFQREVVTLRVSEWQSWVSGAPLSLDESPASLRVHVMLSLDPTKRVPFMLMMLPKPHLLHTLFNMLKPLIKSHTFWTSSSRIR